MICVLKRDTATKEIIGFILAADIEDARRQANSTGESALAEALYRMEGPLQKSLAGCIDLPLFGARYTVLQD